MTEQSNRNTRRSGLPILWLFLGFFGIVGAVDAYFVFTALRTNTGVVIEQAYERGLDYNKTLEKARSQPLLRDSVSYDNGTFSWVVKEGLPKEADKVSVTARFIRPVQDGHDFEMDLNDKGGGRYETAYSFPMKGLWQAQIRATWNNVQYQTTQKFIVQ